LSDELDINEASVAVLVDDVVADLFPVGEKAPDPAKARVFGVVAVLRMTVWGLPAAAAH
jgi:hypothetical protein